MKIDIVHIGFFIQLARLTIPFLDKAEGTKLSRNLHLPGNLPWTSPPTGSAQTL